MARIKTDQNCPTSPSIDRAAIAEFFDRRAQKFDQLGLLRTIIYQDKHEDLAERRDAAEKQLLAPKL